MSGEAGLKFKIKNDCEIQGLNFNITSNQFKTTTFRVNFYKIVNELPGQLLNTQDIVFTIKGSALGWVHVDLIPYPISLNRAVEEAAVTIQWLQSEKSEEKSKYFSICAAKSPFRGILPG